MNEDKLRKMAILFFINNPKAYVRYFGTDKVVRSTYIWKKRIEKASK